MLETVCNRLGGTEDRDRNSIYSMALDPLFQGRTGKVNHTNGQIPGSWLPLVRRDGDPHAERQLCGQAVEGESRKEADDTLRNQLADLCQADVFGDISVDWDIESARWLLKKTLIAKGREVTAGNSNIVEV